MRTEKRTTTRSSLLIVLLFSIIGLVFFLNHDFSKPVDISVKADQIVVEKGRRVMTIYSKGIKAKSYRISLGRAPVGDKQY